MLLLFSQQALSDSFETPWAVMGFSRQEYWSGLPFLSPGDLPDPAIEPVAFAISPISGGFFTAEPPGKSQAGMGQSQFRLSVTCGLSILKNLQ